LPIDESLICSGNNTIASGQDAARIILSRQPLPTAVFCANDEMAIGATIVAKEMGFRVPEDVSIIGFDDVDIAAYYDPPITTVQLPRAEIGRTGMKELLALLDGKRKRTGRRIVLPHHLVVRQSTRSR
jgi:LacI family repressor for deo operon, udp, cdd, tsx, nupC, and nupG